MTFEVHAYAAARSARTQRRRASQVTVTRVVPALWDHALRAANGDGSRITIISTTEVIITNKGRGQQR